MMNRAKLANKMKSEFLATMSHELRTPLNGILGAAEIMKAQAISSETETWRSMIQNSGHHLLNIINNILDYSKMETGDIAFEEHAFFASGYWMSKELF